MGGAVRAGAPLQVVPVGLGGRDTLRLEMGYALHGNDISTDTDLFEARLGWAVAMGKDDFRGREALAARKEAGPSCWSAWSSGDRLIPRHGMAVYDGDRPVGEVTSGTFSPTLRQGIALAYVPCPTRPPRAPSSRSTCAASAAPSP